MICTRYLRRQTNWVTSFLNSTETAKKLHVEPEALTFKALDEEHTLAESKSFNFVMKTKGIEKGLNDLFVHSSWVPASLLLHNHYHLFPPSMPVQNRQQNYKAFEKLLAKKFEDAYKKCSKPNEIFHMSRRVQLQKRILENRVGIIDNEKFKHYSLWIPYRELRGINTLKNYESKGVQIDILKQRIFPTGKIWLPTRQNYLTLFDKYLANTGTLSKCDTAIDVGCGSGVLSFILSKKLKKNVKIIGIDINQNAVFTSNINASKLHIQNFKAYQFDLLKLENFRLFKSQQQVPKQYSLIVCNPPWIVAKKLNYEIGLEDGVYDQKQKFLNALLKFAELHLKQDGKLILFYSTLSQQLELTKNSIESLCQKYKLKISEKMQAPYIQKLQSNDPLAVFKQQSKIQLYQLKRL